GWQSTVSYLVTCEYKAECKPDTGKYSLGNRGVLAGRGTPARGGARRPRKPPDRRFPTRLDPRRPTVAPPDRRPTGAARGTDPHPGFRPPRARPFDRLPTPDHDADPARR